VPIYGTLVTSAIAMLTEARELGIALFLTALSPAGSRRSARRSSCSRRFLDHLRHVGLFVFALFQSHAQSFLIRSLATFLFRALFAGYPPLGIGMLTAEPDPVDHGDPVHRCGARCVRDRPADAEGSAYGLAPLHGKSFGA
jgi:hypothetical protein